MKTHELHNNAVVRRAISPVAIGTTGTGKAGKIIDRQGFDGVEFVVNFGAVTATSAVFTPSLKEGDVTSSMTAVVSGDMVPTTGAITAAGLPATTPRASGVSMNVSKKIGYKGSKRYVQLGLSSTVTAGTLISADAILFNPEVGPVTAAQALTQ